MSSQTLKQLKIKTSMLKRLRKQYQSYTKQTKSISNKIDLLNEQQPITEDIQYEIKKNKQFLQESQSVLSNVKQKLIEAFQGLTLFISEKSENEQIKGTEQLNVAEQLVLQIQTYLESI